MNPTRRKLIFFENISHIKLEETYRKYFWCSALGQKFFYKTTPSKRKTFNFYLILRHGLGMKRDICFLPSRKEVSQAVTDSSSFRGESVIHPPQATRVESSFVKEAYLCSPRLPPHFSWCPFDHTFFLTLWGIF